MLNRYALLFAVAFVAAALVWSGCGVPAVAAPLPAQAEGKAKTKAIKPAPAVPPAPQKRVSPKPVLTWPKVEGAVAYELELWAGPPPEGREQGPDPDCFFATRHIYVNGFNADLTPFFELDSFYWRVRGLDYDGNPLSPFPKAEKLYVDRQREVVLKPVPTSVFNQGNGTTLLYPVYAWIPVAGAARYEVEILAAPPENPNGTAPSVHRIDAGLTAGFDYYDVKPRVSDKPFYWRVRGLDAGGNPVGVYSDAGQFGANPSLPVAVATYGDSITHGGGGVSYSPADCEYSYQHYLDFPSINLGRSGDTSAKMVERFERDVLPFHPQYLLILGGTNSLRGGTPAASVIADLQALKEKCLAHGIRPVFLTLPPINPDNIMKVFEEPSAPGWQEQLRLVNAFIRTQVHIDAARGLESADGILPARLAVDGLHPDIAGKKLIAAAVNANWSRITASD